MDHDGDSSATAAAPEITVRDNDVEDRFELFVDGAPAGFAGYQLRDENYALTHTEIDPDFEGRGMGSQLITRALDQIRAGGHGLLPYCPFVRSFLTRHDEYVDLVPPSYRREFGLPAP